MLVESDLRVEQDLPMAKRKGPPLRAGGPLDVDQVLADHKAELQRSERTSGYHDPWDWRDQYGSIGGLMAAREPSAHTPAPVRATPPVGGTPHNQFTSSRQRKAAKKKK